jgi:hypothetical protein
MVQKNGPQCENMWSQPNLRYYHGIWPEGMSKTITNLELASLWQRFTPGASTIHANLQTEKFHIYPNIYTEKVYLLAGL